MKLNLGCCDKHIKGFTNVDSRNMAGVDMVVNLNDPIWPWDSNSVAEIHASHVLEHLDNPIKAMQEIHRILAPGGRIEIYCPNAHGYLGVGMGHNSFFSSQWFLDLDGNKDLQNDIGQLFVNTKLELKVFHHLSKRPYSKLAKKLIYTWEVFFNSTKSRKLYWEMSGILVPGEIHWTGYKSHGINEA